MIDASTFTNICLCIVTIAVSLIGVLLMILYKKSEKTESALNDHKVMVARDYLQRSELTAIITAVNARMDKMEQWIGRRFDALMGDGRSKNGNDTKDN